MNTQPQQAFDEWFAKERANGLLDFKLAVTHNRETSRQSVIDEILNIEALICSGRITTLPEPITFVPTHIAKTIHSVTL